jgi:predicted nucleic acid-binding protein
MKIDRSFLDANILFSAAYGSPGLSRLWDLAHQGKCIILASGYVVEEGRRNLADPEQIKKLDTLLATVQIVAEVDPQVPCPIDLPEKDRPVLLAAISARADFFLTGDVTHFGKFLGKSAGGVKICRPRYYLNLGHTE